MNDATERMEDAERDARQYERECQQGLASYSATMRDAEMMDRLENAERNREAKQYERECEAGLASYSATMRDAEMMDRLEQAERNRRLEWNR